MIFHHLRSIVITPAILEIAICIKGELVNLRFYTLLICIFNVTLMVLSVLASMYKLSKMNLRSTVPIFNRPTAFMLSLLAVIFTLIGCESKTSPTAQDNLVEDLGEKFRPIYHFTPPSQWMNDPNGMVFYEGEYHLFYQYYPDSTVWGPMHWGHAVSTDLVQWEHLPIALYPDSLGYIFSGSAVIDWKNTTGFGSVESPAMVAIYTYHDPVLENQGSDLFQTQGIAYSLDKGRTWIKYENNPVIANPGIRDFRDPKVAWHEASNQWIMILAVKDRVHLYSSPDLKAWAFESEFGAAIGAHGGVWECPDLFQLTTEDGTSKWLMLVSINPGGPQGGSATQYFVGDFDGKKFVPSDTITRWVDYGADNYAGVTFSDIPATDGRRLFIGWMSNWQYAQIVPTINWRSAMTIPRQLQLKKEKSGYRLVSAPVVEMDKITANVIPLSQNASVANGANYSLAIAAIPKEPFTLVLSNNLSERVEITITKSAVSIDRTKSGITNFHPAFAAVHSAPLGGIKVKTVKVFVDASSIEVFVNNGELVLTDLIFPNAPLQNINYSGKIGSLKLGMIAPEIIE
jgi:fructan beta-fructosidase